MRVYTPDLAHEPAFRLYERGTGVKPTCFGGTERGCERWRLTAWMPAELRSDGWLVASYGPRAGR
jgi:hypothetical protein